VPSGISLGEILNNFARRSAVIPMPVSATTSSTQLPVLVLDFFE
jgi:hypothetical protein